jgi:hypothetical protein
LKIPMLPQLRAPITVRISAILSIIIVLKTSKVLKYARYCGLILFCRGKIILCVQKIGYQIIC